MDHGHLRVSGVAICFVCREDIAQVVEAVEGRTVWQRAGSVDGNRAVSRGWCIVESVKGWNTRDSRQNWNRKARTKNQHQP